VSTDDDDISAVARMCGAEVWDRSDQLATDESTVDELVAFTRLEWHGGLLVFQPTVPQAASSLGWFVGHARTYGWGTAMGVACSHSVWNQNGVVELAERGNRQNRRPLLIEVGVRYYPAGESKIAQVLQCAPPLVDIDTPDDLASVRRERKRILFRTIVNRQVGTGHVRRCVQIADELQHHDIMIAPHPDSDLNLFVSLAAGYPMVADGYPADLIVNDCLDTTEEQMFELRFNAPVVALEDLGAGAQHATLVINELYAAHARHELTGPDWAVLRPVFSAVPWPHRFDHSGAPRLLVTFGGTDPAGLTERLHKMSGVGPFVDWDWDTVIVPPPSEGRPSEIASLLCWADLVVCSGGRTVWEAMACGTPALVLCQNPRELTHTHLSPKYGVLNLGLGKLVSDDDLRRHLTVLLNDRVLLAEMSERMTGVVDGKGALRIAHRVEGILGGL
jgi:spore coat polysaccharide biosynthesis predicted glycosyltransferase SpsG